MTKYIFSALILCSLLATGVTRAQTGPGLEPNTPVVTNRLNRAILFAYPEKNVILLRWRMGNETNIDHYVMERSTDSIHFTALHELPARGVIDIDSNYLDRDSYPDSRTNYYRLQIVYTSGESIYYPIVRTDLPDKDAPRLTPTVLHMGGTVRLDGFHDQPLTVSFFNERGAQTGMYIVNSTSFDINTTGWSQGVYFYRISDGRHPLLDAGKILVM